MRPWRPITLPRSSWATCRRSRRVSSSSTCSTRTASGSSTSCRARYSRSSATSGALGEVLRLQQLLNRLGGQGALAKPVLHFLLVQLDQRRIVLRVVPPHDLDELAVARRARVGHDN